MEKEISSADVNSRVMDYQEIITSFADLLEKENQALRDYNLDEVSQLLEQKNKIVAAYRSMVAYFIKNQDDLNLADLELKKQLKEKSLRLDEQMKENEMLLKTKMQTSKTVMDSIVRMAKVTSTASSTAYGSQGKYAPVDNTQNALALNRTL